MTLPSSFALSFRVKSVIPFNKKYVHLLRVKESRLIFGSKKIN